jgi:hypothetical protein
MISRRFKSVSTCCHFWVGASAYCLPSAQMRSMQPSRHRELDLIESMIAFRQNVQLSDRCGPGQAHALPDSLNCSSSSSGMPIWFLYAKTTISSTRSIVALSCSGIQTAYRNFKILSSVDRTRRNLSLKFLFLALGEALLLLSNSYYDGGCPHQAQTSLPIN